MAINMPPSGHVPGAALHLLRGVLCNLVFWNEGHDLATCDHANLPYTIGVKVCIYTVSPKYGEYGVTPRTPLPNVFGRNGTPNAHAAHSFWCGSS